MGRTWGEDFGPFGCPEGLHVVVSALLKAVLGQAREARSNRPCPRSQVWRSASVARGRRRGRRRVFSGTRAIYPLTAHSSPLSSSFHLTARSTPLSLRRRFLSGGGSSTAPPLASTTGHESPPPPSLHRRFFVTEFVNGGKIIHTPRVPPNRLRSVDPWLLNCLP